MASSTGAAGVVPLHPAETFGSAWTQEQHAAALGQRDPQPCLTYRGGPLLTAVRPYLVFWGQWWSGSSLTTGSSAPQTSADYIAALEGFWRYVVTSPLMDQLAEYNVPNGPQIGHGTYGGAVTLPVPLGPLVTDEQIQQMLRAQMQPGGALPAPDPNNLYCVYVQPGTAIVQDGDQSCSIFCGYHDCAAGAPALFYAVLAFPDCSGCVGPMAPLAALTSTSSHELCEAATDPIPGSGWYDDQYGEIADITAWMTKEIGGFTVQQEWSNARHTAV